MMPSRCPECGGSGFVTLLVSRRPCKACAGREAVNTMTFGPSPLVGAFEAIQQMREMEDELLRSFALPLSALGEPP